MSELVVDPKSQLLGLLELDGNGYCADCSTPRPTWVSVNNKVFICTYCSGIHRSLGVEYSFVQSVMLDEWKQAVVDSLQDVRTAQKNESELEYCVPEGVLKPNPQSSRAEKEEYINMKYVDKKFMYSEGKISRKPESAWPAAGTVPTQTSVGEIEFVGIVHVKLISAKDLINADFIGQSDPYIVAILGRQRFKTKVIKNNLNPIWNENLMFSWNGTDKLELYMFDEDITNDDDPLGQLDVDLTQFGSGVVGHIDELLQNTIKGSVQLDITVDLLGH